MSSTTTDLGRTIITMRRAPRCAQGRARKDAWADAIGAALVAAVLFLAAWTRGSTHMAGFAAQHHPVVLSAGLQIWVALTTPLGAAAIAVGGAAFFALISALARGLLEPLSRTSAIASNLPIIGAPVANAIALEVLHVIAGWMRVGDPIALAIRKTTTSFVGFPIANRLKAAVPDMADPTHALSSFLARAGLAKTYWTMKLLPVFEAEEPIDAACVEECYPDVFEREPSLFALRLLSLCGLFGLVLYFTVWGPIQYALAMLK